MKISIFIFMIFVFFASFSHASIRRFSVEGTLSEYNKDSVFLKIKDKKVKVPRTSVPHVETFLTGKSIVSAKLSDAELLDVIHQMEKKKQQQ